MTPNAARLRPPIVFVSVFAVMVCASWAAWASTTDRRAAPIRLAHATAPFRSRGFRLLPDLGGHLPPGVVEAYGFDGALLLYCHLFVLTNTAQAKKLAQRPYQDPSYRVSNVLLTIAPGLPPAKTTGLLAALATLGKPVRSG